LNKRFLIALSVILGTYAGVHAERSAGIVLYLESGNEVFLLLADHRAASHRGWAAFGGRGDKGESRAETAARETEEETRGYFSKGDLLRAIKDQTPVIDANGFALYFAQVAFVPAQRVSNNPIPKDDDSYSERGPYAWIPYSELEKHFLTPVKRNEKHPIDLKFLPKGSRTDWIWSVWLCSMRLAIKAEALPWSKE